MKKLKRNLILQILIYAIIILLARLSSGKYNDFCYIFIFILFSSISIFKYFKLKKNFKTKEKH